VIVARDVTLINVLGLHARAAARLVQVASRFHCRITLSKDGRSVDAKSILGVLMLAGSMGETLRLSAEGADSEEAVEALASLIRSRFGESR
jgi:phosphotransferase system HPr (HPr) family protein